MTIYFLDMGLKQYGDCIVIIQGERKILIDFGKPADRSSLRIQLKKIFKQSAPFHFDLLVLTHNHDDHIGSLPEMISSGEIKAAKYLLADPEFRWGKDDEIDSDSFRDGITEALFEEDHSNLPDDELEQFLLDIDSLDVRYKKMIKDLKEDGADVILYRGRHNGDIYSALEQEFSDFGLKILGPTKEHLEITQKALLGTRAAISDFFESPVATDSIPTKVDLYRNLFSESAVDNAFFMDAKKNSGSINNESIVIKVSEEGFSTLLAGDMQFAEPDVTGLENEMEALIQTVFENGPYDLIKTCHHTSHNGLSAAMLDRWIEEGTEFFIHSGGKKDDKHPEVTVLKLLKDRKSKIKFARTDRNSLIKAEKENGELTVFLSKGDFNNFAQNIESDTVEEPEIRQITPTNTGVLNSLSENVNPEVPNPKIPQSSSDIIEVTAKIPTSVAKVIITVETENEKKKTLNQPEPATRSIATNGRFDNLIFVTNSTLLSANIGEAETEKVLTLLKQIPLTKLLDLPTEGVLETAKRVTAEIDATTKGIVIIGGYDVIPAAQLNVLPDETRQKIADEAEGDEEEIEEDDFIVWNDDVYADIDNDFLPELPVSRIPDGKNASLVFNALNAPPYVVQNKFGIRNIKRPFAIDVFDKIPFTKHTQLEVSENYSPKSVTGEGVSGAVYFMLHGSSGDATRFAGEREDSGSFEAFDIYNVPKTNHGTVVFSGCCYGALIALPKADRKEPEIKIRSRTAEQSIALAFLQGSANAFVGCTGAHYSPKRQEDNFLGKPMHESFWKEIEKGVPPSLALFNAKKEYASNMPHGLTRTILKAMEIKTLHQFTCLGLGW